MRQGEALDVPVVAAWLKERLPHLDGVPTVTQYSGGASNWTYRLSYANDDVVLRRAPAGTKAAGAHDMAREFRFQQALKPSFDLVPRMLALCEDAA
ncbi:MAG: phosphotransferase, partial [Lysobacterales bacterium]